MLFFMALIIPNLQCLHNGRGMSPVEMHHLLLTAEPSLVESARPSSANSLFHALRPQRNLDPDMGQEEVGSATVGSGMSNISIGEGQGPGGGREGRCLPPLIPVCFFGHPVGPEGRTNAQPLGSDPHMGYRCWDSGKPRGGVSDLDEFIGMFDKGSHDTAGSVLMPNIEYDQILKEANEGGK